jgi:hypothetical protein
MRNTIRTFMLFEAATFVVASLIHYGALITGYAHHAAHIAEGIIALILLVGVAVTWIRPPLTRQAGLYAQGLALAGTLIGVFTIIVGVGPRTVPDIIYHVGIIVVLVWGLIVARRAAT